MKTKHTPVPWSIAKDAHSIECIEIRSESMPICLIANQDKSNALLIAASPDMLSFIQKLVDDYYNERIGDFEEIIEQAHELIKKATGDE